MAGGSVSANPEDAFTLAAVFPVEEAVATTVF
jgi:hypothetical protein